MIVERRIYRPRPGREQATAGFVKEVWAVFGFPNACRLYLPVSGPNNVVYHELEFKDWQEREQVWADFFARPEMPDWVEKWQELTESGGSTEFSRLVG